jgi:DNA-binding beta-propeller fold protein YncE
METNIAMEKIFPRYRPDFGRCWALGFVSLALSGAGELPAHTVGSDYEVKPIPLLDKSGAIVLDHLAYDRSKDRLWVPASNTGDVDVIDCGFDTVSHVSGFSTGEVELEGRKARLGPTAVSVGEGVVYIGNRGNSSLCVIDSQTLARDECVPVSRASSESDTGPHQVAYVAATREVWVTTGPGKSIQIFDVSEAGHPKFKTKIDLDGATEGAAIDTKRGCFYTNISEKGTTTAIDLKTRKVVSKWNVGSNELQGLALDSQRGFLFVACTDHVVNLDITHDGKLLDSIATGAGLDDIDFSPEQKLLYAAASITATLSIIEVSDDGKFHLKALVPTAKGVRGVAAGKNSTAYLIDPGKGQILKLSYESHDKLTNK